MSEFMPEPVTAPPPETQGLSQIARVVNAYVAPSQTFTDIRRSASWWLPFLLGVVVSFMFAFAVGHEVGFQKVAENIAQNSAQMQERMSTMTPAQAQGMINGIATFTKVATHVAPIFTLLIALIAAAILMASFNFGLGAQLTFQQSVAVWFYAGLPLILKWLLAAITLFTGMGADQFQINNPLGSNIAFYLSPDAPKWLGALLSSVDIFTLWTVVLLIVGYAIVAKVKRSQAAAVIIGWWVLIILGSTVMAAVRG